MRLLFQRHHRRRRHLEPSLSATEIASLYALGQNATQSWSNVTKTLNATVGTSVGWKVYANDTSNNWNTSASELTTASLTYSNNSTNNTVANAPTLFSLNWTGHDKPERLCLLDEQHRNVGERHLPLLRRGQRELDRLRQRAGRALAHEQGTGNITDASGNGNSGNLTNASNGTVSWTTGKFGNGLNFSMNGTVTGGYVNIGARPSLLVNETNGWTVEAWIYPVSAGNGRQQSIYDAGNSQWWIYIQTNGALSFQNLTSPWTSMSSTSVLQNNQWYHVVVTADGTTKKIYLNGILNSTATLSVPNATTSRISGYGAIGIPSFNGTIYEVAIWNRSLSAAEIASTLRVEQPVAVLVQRHKDTEHHSWPLHRLVRLRQRHGEN